MIIVESIIGGLMAVAAFLLHNSYCRIWSQLKKIVSIYLFLIFAREKKHCDRSTYWKNCRSHSVDFVTLNHQWKVLFPIFFFSLILLNKYIFFLACVSVLSYVILKVAEGQSKQINENSSPTHHIVAQLQKSNTCNHWYYNIFVASFRNVPLVSFSSLV